MKTQTRLDRVNGQIQDLENRVSKMQKMLAGELAPCAAPRELEKAIEKFSLSLELLKMRQVGFEQDLAAGITRNNRK